MEDSGRFSEYLFAKMGPTCGDGGVAASAETVPSTTSAPLEYSRVRKCLQNNLLLVVTLSGVIFGAILGFALRPLELDPDVIMLVSYPGELFMRILKLMILPLLVASLIAGSASLNAKMNGKIAIRTLVYFIITSMFNAFLGVCLAVAIHPGDPGMKAIVDGHVKPGSGINIMDSLLDLGRNVFPDNLFQAAFQQAHTVYVESEQSIFSKSENTTDDLDENVSPPNLVRAIKYRSGTNTLGIVFFCLVFGTVLGTVGPRGKVVVDFFTAIFEVVMKMVTGVMWLTPIGISSVIAGKILSVADIALVMSQLGWFITTVSIGVFFYQLIVMQLIYFAFLRKNPYKFYWGLVQATLTASATASTAAALPVTFRLMDEKLKIDTRVTRFVLPIGCNINMDGTALFVAIASIFIAQMNSIPLGFGELCTVFLTSTAASISSASVPSAALVLILIVLSAIDAPPEDVSLLFAIDWFVDRIRTSNNMLGDCYAAAVVEQLSKKELMAYDAASIFQEPSTNNLPLQLDPEMELHNNKLSLSPDTVIVDMDLSMKHFANDVKHT